MLLQLSSNHILFRKFKGFGEISEALFAYRNNEKGCEWCKTVPKIFFSVHLLYDVGSCV